MGAASATSILVCLGCFLSKAVSSRMWAAAVLICYQASLLNAALDFMNGKIQKIQVIGFLKGANHVPDSCEKADSWIDSLACKQHISLRIKEYIFVSNTEWCVQGCAAFVGLP